MQNIPNSQAFAFVSLPAKITLGLRHALDVDHIITIAIDYFNKNQTGIAIK